MAAEDDAPEAFREFREFREAVERARAEATSPHRRHHHHPTTDLDALSQTSTPRAVVPVVVPLTPHRRPTDAPSTSRV